jgi:hypothetical protein
MLFTTFLRIFTIAFLFTIVTALPSPYRPPLRIRAEPDTLLGRSYVLLNRPKAESPILEASSRQVRSNDPEARRRAVRFQLRRSADSDPFGALAI